MMTVIPIQAFSDNYIWLIKPKNSSNVYVVDPGDATPIIEYLQTYQLCLAGILITHHHYDHTSGIAKLTDWSNNDIPVYGPASENIKGITHAINQQQDLSLLNTNLQAKVLFIPGHTLGHISYLIEDCLFCGDTLFSGGCGRLFEGSPSQMLHSLNKLAQLNDDTKVYCAHEYTQSNLKFALSIEPNNQDLISYSLWVNEQRSKHQPSLPSSIKREKMINPFLRVNTKDIAEKLDASLGQENSDDVNRFALLRQWKDNF